MKELEKQLKHTLGGEILLRKPNFNLIRNWSRREKPDRDRGRRAHLDGTLFWRMKFLLVFLVEGDAVHVETKH